MPKKLHNDVLKSVHEAHPGYSSGRSERETNAVLTNIGKGMVRGKGGKMVYRKGGRGKTAAAGKRKVIVRRRRRRR